MEIENNNPKCQKQKKIKNNFIFSIWFTIHNNFICGAKKAKKKKKLKYQTKSIRLDVQVENLHVNIWSL